VSTDRGSSWNLANGTTSWSYLWIISGDGTYNIQSKAEDRATETAVELAKSLEEQYFEFETIVIADGKAPRPEAAIIAAEYKAPVVYVFENRIPRRY
jgi:hypothetical protein